MHGDSGSWLLSRHTNLLVGLIFGGDKDRSINLYTPGEHLRRSIARETGLEVIPIGAGAVNFAEEEE